MSWGLVFVIGAAQLWGVGLSQMKHDANIWLFANPRSYPGTKDPTFCFPNKVSTISSVHVSGCFFCSPSVISFVLVCVRGEAGAI